MPIAGPKELSSCPWTKQGPRHGHAPERVDENRRLQLAVTQAMRRLRGTFVEGGRGRSAHGAACPCDLQNAAHHGTRSVPVWREVMVGEEGFEPPTTSTQSSCTTRLCDSPETTLFVARRPPTPQGGPPQISVFPCASSGATVSAVLCGLALARPHGGRSSVGRALDCDSGCRGFDPRRSPHPPKKPREASFSGD